MLGTTVKVLAIDAAEELPPDSSCSTAKTVWVPAVADGTIKVNS
jgi:hypothetical protein